jgi:hypothetical protein
VRLFTIRRPGVLPGGAACVVVNEMAEQEAQALLTVGRPRLPTDLVPDGLRVVAGATGIGARRAAATRPRRRQPQRRPLSARLFQLPATCGSSTMLRCSAMRDVSQTSNSGVRRVFLILSTSCAVSLARLTSGRSGRSVLPTTRSGSSVPLP